MIRCSRLRPTSCIFRRYFHYAAFLVFFLTAVSVGAQSGPPPFDITVKRLTPRVAVFYGDPWDNAIVAIATQKGIVVIDAPFSKTIAKGFRDAVEAEFKRGDFAYLVNTHDHVCHIGGNEAYVMKACVRGTLSRHLAAGLSRKPTVS